MDKTPTPKQVRYHFGKIARLHDRLQDALTAAHNAGVIDYDQPDYQTDAPCKSHHDLWGRILKTTEKQLARAMRAEIYAE